MPSNCNSLSRMLSDIPLTLCKFLFRRQVSSHAILDTTQPIAVIRANTVRVTALKDATRYWLGWFRNSKRPVKLLRNKGFWYRSAERGGDRCKLKCLFLNMRLLHTRHARRIPQTLLRRLAVWLPEKIRRPFTDGKHVDFWE